MVDEDLTDREIVMRALRDSEELLRIATQNANLFTWEVDVASGRSTVSENSADVVGFDLAAHLADPFLNIHPDDREQVRREVGEAIAFGRPFHSDQRMLNPDTGAIIRLRVDAVLIRDGAGGRTRLVGISRNVTVEKLAEEALEQRVVERTSELRRSAQALEALLNDRAVLLRQIVNAQEDERQRIARELHDELGQPLTALQLGLGALPTSSPDKLRQLMEIVTDIDHTVERLAFEIRPAALTELGLDAAIRQLIETFQSESGVAADLHLMPEMHRERLADIVGSTLYRVLQEALTNVWRHSSATGVSIIVDQRNDHVQMIIEDNGCGFDAKAVFNRDEGGRRFGLVGVRQRVEVVGGTVNIESSEGSGTTLYVRVPIAPREGRP
jgi:PAS domain S-box-containing protein